MDRLALSLERLLPHLALEDLAVTGGVALELHVPGSRTEVADLDLVARRMDAVATTVAREFLISHHHAPGRGVPKAMLQLVDPVSRMRVDVFPDLAGVVKRAGWVRMQRWVLPVVRAEDLLAHKLQTLRKASATRPEDPKHWHDARRLALHLGEELPDLELYLAPSVYGTAPMPCERCQRSTDATRPLAPREAIFTLLGYI